MYDARDQFSGHAGETNRTDKAPGGPLATTNMLGPTPAPPPRMSLGLVLTPESHPEVPDRITRPNEEVQWRCYPVTIGLPITTVQP